MFTRSVKSLRRTKPIMNIFTALALFSLFVSACSPATISGTKTPESNLSPAPTLHMKDPSNVADLNEEAVTSGPIVITFAVEETSRNVYERLAESFHQENPSMTVQIVTPPDGFAIWNSENLRTLASFADTTILFGGRNRFINNPSTFLDLTHAIDSDPSFKSEDFWKGSLNACEDNQGRVLGVPITLTIMSIFYDPIAFDNADIPYPYPGWSWIDFQKTVTALSEKSARESKALVDSVDFASSVLAPITDLQLLGHGGNIDSNALSDMFNWYIELSRAHQISSINTTDNTSSFSNPPVLWTGPLNASLPSDESKLAIEQYKVAPFPTLNNQTEGSNVIWPSCGVVSRGTKYPRAAWAWINFLSHQWPYENLPSSFLTAQVPARQSVADRIQYWNNIPDELRDSVRFGLEHGWYGSLYPQAFQTVRDALVRALEGENFASALTDVIIAAEPTPNDTPIVVATPMIQPAIPEGSRVIRYLNPTDLPDASQRYQSYMEEFQHIHPEISVQVSSDFSWPGGDILPYLVKDYDCFYAGMESISQPQLLYNLNDFIDKEESNFTNDFYPGRIDTFRSEDQIYGLPASNMLYLIYYNADLLAQKSLQPPSPDWTFEDFLRLTSSLSSGTPAGTVFGSGGTEDLFLASRGIRWVDLSVDPPLVNFNQSSTTEAINWFNQLVKDGVVYPLSGVPTNTLNQAIMSGQVAFWSGLSRRESTDSFPFTYGIAPIPTVSSSTGSVGWLMGAGQFISKQSQNPEACWAWIKFLSQKPAAFPNVPARRSVVQSSDYVAMVGEETARVYNAAQTNTPKAELSLNFGPVRHWAWQVLSSTSQGSDVNVSLNEAQRKTDTYLQCLDDAGLLHVEIISALPGNKSQREQIGNCAKQADPSYTNLMLP